MGFLPLRVTWKLGKVKLIVDDETEFIFPSCKEVDFFVAVVIWKDGSLLAVLCIGTSMELGTLTLVVSLLVCSLCFLRIYPRLSRLLSTL